MAQLLLSSLNTGRGDYPSRVDARKGGLLKWWCQLARCSGSVFFLVMLGTVSCSQAGALDTGARISPTAPSSVGLGAADISSGVVNTRAGRPSTSYDATGSWHWVATYEGQIIDVSPISTLIRMRTVRSLPWARVRVNCSHSLAWPLLRRQSATR